MNQVVAFWGRVYRWRLPWMRSGLVASFSSAPQPSPRGHEFAHAR